MTTQLLPIIHYFHQRNWAPATSANYSLRLPDHAGFTISRSGVDKSAFSEQDLMDVDAQGQPTPAYAHLKPSAETLLHALLYRLFPATGAILHTHSVVNTVFSRLQIDKGHAQFKGYELQKAIAGVSTHESTLELPVFPNSQDMSGLCGRIEPYLLENPACKGFLLSSHGLYAWGADLAEAKRHVEAYEFLMECALRER
jgi:methylthioribulose-1-phosphate dehydratase